MKTLLYQCPSGISGDMNLGAMVALGVDPTALEAELRKLPYSGWTLRFAEDSRSGISGIRCDVIAEEGEDGGHHSHGHHHHHPDGDAQADPQHHHHDHHHHDHGQDAHSHSHSHDSSGSSDHSAKEPRGHHHHHVHRCFAEIREAIEGSGLSLRVKRDAVACFRVLAEAEGAVHGIDPEKVHFHEVGAIDSIVDMVGAAVCWDLLGVERVVCSVLEVGGGTVRCAHGRMPVPAPATARLLQDVPYLSGGVQFETTTPTGAALLRGIGCEFQGATAGRQLRTGIGVGQRNPPGWPNVLHASLIEESAAVGGSGGESGLERDEVWELAANLDDMTGEAVGYLCSRLRAGGALDVWQVPAFFKRDRAGCVVHALVEKDSADRLEELFFLHSATLGVRRQLWRRGKLRREIREMDTEWGPVRVKLARGPGNLSRHKFEYRDLARAAEQSGKPLAEIEAALEKLWREKSV